MCFRRPGLVEMIRSESRGFSGDAGLKTILGREFCFMTVVPEEFSVTRKSSIHMDPWKGVPHSSQWLSFCRRN